MNVFRISPTGKYCGGAAYVAAKTKDDAIKEFCENDYRKYEYEEGSCECNLVANMSYDVKFPFVIFNDLYYE